MAKRPAPPAAQPGLFDTHASTLGIGGPGAAYALLDLPGVGTIGWRCDRAGRYSVVFAVPNTATVTVRLSAAGRRLLSRDVDPQRHVLGPYVRATEQTLVVDQNHEPGRVLAQVQIRFKRPTGSECQVPRTSLELTSHSNSVG